jgi:hypothetical protein
MAHILNVWKGWYAFSAPGASFCFRQTGHVSFCFVPFGVSLSKYLAEMNCRTAAIFHVHKPPRAQKAMTVFAAISRRASIVDITDGKPTAGPELRQNDVRVWQLCHPQLRNKKKK